MHHAEIKPLTFSADKPTDVWWMMMMMMMMMMSMIPLDLCLFALCLVHTPTLSLKLWSFWWWWRHCHWGITVPCILTKWPRNISLAILVLQHCPFTGRVSPTQSERYWFHWLLTRAQETRTRNNYFTPPAVAVALDHVTVRVTFGE